MSEDAKRLREGVQAQFLRHQHRELTPPIAKIYRTPAQRYPLQVTIPRHSTATYVRPYPHRINMATECLAAGARTRRGLLSAYAA